MTHGMSNTRLYRIWTGIKSRCYNPNEPNYKHYGARGITMCEEWRNDFLAFYTWAMSAGYDETAPRGQFTIEREDNNGPYSPENCRWATQKEQMNNRRNNKRITIGQETKTLSQLCDEKGLNYPAELKRLSRRTEGRKPMSAYNDDREAEMNRKAEHLRELLRKNPDWTNAQLAREMQMSVRSVQRLKNRILGKRENR